METTIQVSHKLREALRLRKMSPNESYENIIWDLIEDSQELSDEVLDLVGIARPQLEPVMATLPDRVVEAEQVFAAS